MAVCVDAQEPRQPEAVAGGQRIGPFGETRKRREHGGERAAAGKQSREGSAADPAEKSAPSLRTRCHESRRVSGGIDARRRDPSSFWTATGRTRFARSQARILSSDHLQKPQSSS